MKTLVILKKSIKKIGKTSDIVSVKRGYAWNFLIPKGYAVLFNKDNESEINRIKDELIQKDKENDDFILKIEDSIKNISFLEFIHKSTECGVLYGSIKKKDVINKLSDKIGFKIIDNSDITFQLSPSIIKNTGCHIFKILSGINVIKSIFVFVAHNRDSISVLKDKFNIIDDTK